MNTALEKQALTQQTTSNEELEQLAYYLLKEIQNEIDLGSKVADEILYRALARVKKEKVNH